MKTKGILIYVLIIYLISWAIQLVAIYWTDGIASDDAELFLLCTMLVPTIVTSIYLFRDKSLRSKVLWKPNLNIFKTIIAGVLIPTIIAFTVVFIFIKMGYGNTKWFTFSYSDVTILGGPWILGIGTNSWFLFIANIVVTAFVYSLISGIPAAAEEFAWRGFLQGILIDKLGITKGVVVLGLIWSFWHLPALLAGYNHPEHPVLGSFLLQPIQEVGISFFLAWLTISSRSFIPAAVAHGAGNSIQEGVISNIELAVPVVYKDLITLLITVGVGIIYWYVLKTRNRKENGV